MSTKLGKRKRQVIASVKQDAEDTRDEEATRALFQRAFEKKFKALAAKPLNTNTKSSKVEVEVESGSQESDWEGLSDESEDAVQIVDYTHANERTDDSAVADKSLEKLFMVSLPAEAIVSLC
jgi:5-methylcytosine-specific restriction endonuclease McrBC regulatory subunit McrC